MSCSAKLRRTEINNSLQTETVSPSQPSRNRSRHSFGRFGGRIKLRLAEERVPNVGRTEQRPSSRCKSAGDVGREEGRQPEEGKINDMNSAAAAFDAHSSQFGSPISLKADESWCSFDDDTCFSSPNTLIEEKTVVSPRGSCGKDIAVASVPSMNDGESEALRDIGEDNDEECEKKRSNEENESCHGTASENGEEEVREEETEEERLQREQEESEALARQLMAEEAMESYAMSAEFLMQNAESYSSEDYAALQAAMAEEDPESEEYDEDEYEEEELEELSYETLLRLGERLGDVKQERWALIAKDHIERLPKFEFTSTATELRGKSESDSEVKCLVCQCAYEQGEALRRLPCHHCFHTDCVDQWLLNKDICPYCRQSIVRDS